MVLGNFGVVYDPMVPGFWSKQNDSYQNASLGQIIQPSFALLERWVLEGIGNSIGKYIKTDLERIDDKNYTFPRICVEADLSKGLTDSIKLIYKQQNWQQVLDYENTAFRCRLCRQTGHLQSTCPEAKKTNKKQKGKHKKGWQFSPPDSEEEESEAEEEVTPAEKTEISQEMENQKGTSLHDKT